MISYYWGVKLILLIINLLEEELKRKKKGDLPFSGSIKIHRVKNESTCSFTIFICIFNNKSGDFLTL